MRSWSYLYLCLLFAICVCLSSEVRASEAATRSEPYDYAGYDTTGCVSVPTPTANAETGELAASVSATCGGQRLSAWGGARPYVRWNYEYTGDTEREATLMLKYNFSPGQPLTHCDDPTAGGADATAYVGVKITDVTEDNAGQDSVDIMIESAVSGQYVIPYSANTEGFHWQDQVLTFKPGHHYHIDAYLTVKATCNGGQPLTDGGSVPSAEASLNASADIYAIGFKTLEDPWIRTEITGLWPSVHDTWDVWERFLLATNSGSSYATYQGNMVGLKLSAGGSYNRNMSNISFTCPDAPITYYSVPSDLYVTRLSDTSLKITLPEYTTLPLEGKSWHLTVSVNPEFETPADWMGDVQYVGPLLMQPTIAVMATADQAAVKGESSTDTRSSSSTKSTSSSGEKPKVYLNDDMLMIDPPHFFAPGNWSIVIPVGRFIEIADRVATRSKEPYLAWEIDINVPEGCQKPKINTTGLKINWRDDVTFAVPEPGFSTEPVVLMTMFGIWEQLCRYEGPQGYTLCPSPRFIIAMERLAERIGAKRSALDQQYYLGPNGVCFKLTDPDIVEALQRAEIGEETGTGLPSARPRLRWAALLLTCKRIRRWARRVATINGAAALWADYRPYQQREVTFQGRVQNATGASCEIGHHRNYNVFFDIFPRRQDRLYPDPAEVRGM